MLYLTIFIVLIVLSFIEVATKQSYKKLFIILFIVLSLLTIFRYGVGTDFFSYNILYNTYSPIGVQGIYEEHGEFGFRLLAKMFKALQIDFIFFSMFFSTATCFVFYISIDKQSKYLNFSLLILYAMFWFTYINSGIRQGFALSLFLFSLIYLKKGNYIYYTFIILFGALFHKSILIMLLIPLVMVISTNKLIIAVILSLIIPVLNFFKIDMLSKIINIFGIGYYSNNTFNITAILLRLFVFFFIIGLYYLSDNKGDLENDFYIKISILGYIMYFMLSGNDLVASRLHAYFKIVEILLIPNLICSINRVSNRLILFISYGMIFLPIFYYKEVNAQIDQGMYYDSKVYNYPYTSIFSDLDSVKRVRYIENSSLID